VSPRPRETTDEHLLAAAHRVINRVGPHLTLADVAKEAGVSPATLVQRFGSKRALLLAFVSSASGATGMQFAQIRATHPDPIEAIREAVRCFAQMAPTPEAVSNGLAFLQIDLSDPEFHRHAYVQARDTVEELRRLLEAAIKAGRLERCETRRLARALHAIIGGSMVSWAVLREGPAEKWMLADVDTLLKPLIVKRKSR
jgi:AcrR family transcriptional regulator